MGEERGLRVGGWVPDDHPQDMRTTCEPGGAGRDATLGRDATDRDATSYQQARSQDAGEYDAADRADPWGSLPDADAVARSEAGSGAGRYRGRRRHAGRSGRRAARLGTAAVVAAVGVVLIGSGVLASYLSVPITLPVIPPSPSPSPSAVPAPVAGPPQGTSRLGVAASPAASPVPLPAVPPPASSPPVTRAPSPTASPTASPPPAGPPPLTTVSFEAEAAVLGGDARVIPLPAASGGEVVVVIGWQARHHVRFPAVTMDNAGQYELTLDYAVAPFLTNQDLAGRVSVNGQAPRAVSFPALPDGQTVSSVSVTIALAAGDNEIRFDSPGGWAPNLDRITVSG